MIEKIQSAKQGRVALDSIARNITDSINNEFVYSKFGSKKILRSLEKYSFKK
jgi:hypothetical protein